MDPNTSTPSPSPQPTPSDDAAISAINKLDQETNTPLTSTEAPIAPSPEVPTSAPAPTSETPAAAPAAVSGSLSGGKKQSATTRILVIVLAIAVLGVGGYLVWQFISTGRLF